MRVLAGIIFFLLLLLSPWWAAFIFGFGALVIYKNFWELLAGALLTDILFGAPLSTFHGFTFVLTVVCLLLFILRQVMERRIFHRALTV